MFEMTPRCAEAVEHKNLVFRREVWVEDMNLGGLSI